MLKLALVPEAEYDSGLRLQLRGWNTTQVSLPVGQRVSRQVVLMR
jgi:hypothetical protein